MADFRRAAQAFLPEWAWILAERGQLADLADARLGSGREQHAHSIEQATRVRPLNAAPLFGP